jgi:hypothetical protein
MKIVSGFVATALFSLVFAMPAYAQHGGVSTDAHQPSASAETAVAPAPSAGSRDATPPMMDMCRQMMARMHPDASTDPKQNAEMLQKHGEMMKAMGDMMMKHAQGMPGSQPK